MGADDPNSSDISPAWQATEKKAEAIAQALKKSALFQSLSDGQATELGKRARLMQLMRGQMLFVAGDAAIGM